MNNNYKALYDNKEVKDAINGYLVNNIVSDFSEYPTALKMTYVQETPKAFIKYRKVGSDQVPYIDHFYAERVLNFISNYRWGSEKISSEIVEKAVTTKAGKSTIMFEATVEMKMWIELDGIKIERYIASGHNAYENPATTKADALQSAISKANTKFARQLGAGANVIAEETTAHERVEKHYLKGVEVPSEKKPITDKDFSKFIDKSKEYIFRHKDHYEFTPDQIDALNQLFSQDE